MKNVGTCFLQALRSKKLSIRYIFTERERPTEIVMHKRLTVFSRA